MRIETARRASHWGAAAEMLAPKWFDKNLALTNEQNFEQLRLSLRLAAEAYVSDKTPRTAFGHFAAHYARADRRRRGRHGLNPLVANFGPAQIDRAVLDAVCRLESRSFYDGVRANLAGIDPVLLPYELADLAGFDMARFLAGLAPATAIAARHTVGLVDVISGHPESGERRAAGITARSGRRATATLFSSSRSAAT